MTAEGSEVVWRRTFDPEARGRRRRKLALWYGAPMAAALIVGFLVAGMGAVYGLLILLGAFGLLLLGWMEMISLNERANPELRIEGDSLVMGRKRARIDTAEAWTTVLSQATTSVGAPSPASTQRFELAKLLIRVPVMDDGQRATRPDGGPAFEIVSFAWPSMDADALDGIRQALEPHLSAPWVEPGTLRDL